MADIAGIGASVFDLLFMADRFPSEDTKLKAAASGIQGGGPCATALAAAAKMGVSAEYFGVLGTDFYGRRMMEEFRRYGVAVESVRLVDGAVSAHSVVILNKTGKTRTCVWNPGALPSLKKEDIPPEKLAKAKYLHLDGNHMEAALYAAEKAREYGVKVSLDAGSPYPGIDKLLPLADIIIPSEEFVLQFTGASTAEAGSAEIYRKYHPSVFVVTQGPKGGFLYDGICFSRYAPFPLEIIDTNGAGDTFHGVFLACLVRGMPPPKSARFASAAAAIKCGHFGAREGIPTFEETIKIIQSQDIV
jgi:sugar/nucleoside kinase (ribokinase family)